MEEAYRARHGSGQTRGRCMKICGKFVQSEWMAVFHFRRDATVRRAFYLKVVSEGSDISRIHVTLLGKK